MVRLREETRKEHKALEARVDIESRLGSVETYVALLARMYGFQEPMERRLFASLPADFDLDLSRRRHIPQLEYDLQIHRVDPNLLPLCSDLPLIDTPARAIGAMYVLEGSTLGGQIVSRLIRERLHLIPKTGAAYYAGYQEDNGPMWRAFGAAVEKWIATHGMLDEAIDGARTTFQALEAWIAAEKPVRA